MIVAIHQPNFLPWLGYFFKMTKCDVFVFLDNAQYSKNSFINRNKIKTPQGPLWLTVPVKTKGQFGQPINEVQINYDSDWRSNHLKTLTMNYKKARFFEEIFKGIEQIYYSKEWGNLCEFNITLIFFVTSYLGIKQKFVKASDLDIHGKSTDALVQIVRTLGGDIYLSGFGGSKYQEEPYFENNDIKLQYYDFNHPVYPQLWGDFADSLSVVDLLFNTGSGALEIIKNS